MFKPAYETSEGMVVSRLETAVSYPYTRIFFFYFRCDNNGKCKGKVLTVRATGVTTVHCPCTVHDHRSEIKVRKWSLFCYLRGSKKVDIFKNKQFQKKINLRRGVIDRLRGVSSSNAVKLMVSAANREGILHTLPKDVFS